MESSVDTGNESITAALEAERARLARLIERTIVEPLALLLSQAEAYQQSLAANAQARMAASVLASLAQNVQQRARDLTAQLDPRLLQALGLDAAIDALVADAMRVHGLTVLVDREERLASPERLPVAVELAAFRAAQNAIDRAALVSRASRMHLVLRHKVGQPGYLSLTFSNNGHGGLPDEHGLDTYAVAQVEALNGRVLVAHSATTSAGDTSITVVLPVVAQVILTPREVEVLRLVAGGRSNKQIAATLGIRPRTVNFHLDNLFSKLGVASRTEAAVYAAHAGLDRETSAPDIT